MSSVSCLRAALTLWVNISDRPGQSALYWSMIKGQGEFLSEVVLPKEVTVTWYKSTSAVSWQRDSQHGQTLPPGQARAWYSALGSLVERPPGKTLGSLFCSVTAASAPPLKPYFNLPLYVPLPPPLAVHIKHFLKNRQLASGPISGSVTATHPQLPYVLEWVNHLAKCCCRTISTYSENKTKTDECTNKKFTFMTHYYYADLTLIPLLKRLCFFSGQSLYFHSTPCAM